MSLGHATLLHALLTFFLQALTLLGPSGRQPSAIPLIKSEKEGSPLADEGNIELVLRVLQYMCEVRGDVFLEPDPSSLSLSCRVTSAHCKITFGRSRTMSAKSTWSTSPFNSFTC